MNRTHGEQRRDDAASGTAQWHALVTFLLPALLVVAAVSVYANAVGAPFIFDDEIHIVQRQDQIDQLWPPSEVLANSFRPVVQYSFALNFAAGGLEPAGYRIVNIIIHILAAMTLYGVVRRTAMRVLADGRDRAAATFAFIAALLWIVHPLQTQSVTYIIQRGESLASLFYLLTLYCAIRSVDSEQQRTWWWAGAIAACGLGMGSKAIVMTAPVAVLLWDVVFTKPPLRDTLVRRLPLYGGLAASWIIMVFTGLFQGVMRTTGETAGIGFSVKTVTPIQYLFTQPEVLLHYLKLSFWPRTLVLDYQWPRVEPLASGILPGLIIVFLLLCTVFAVWRRHWAGFAGGMFFLVLAPTSSFIPLRDLAFEHRMYLPLASVIALMIGLTWWMSRPMRERLAMTPRTVQLAGLILVLLLTGALGARTISRNREYHDPVRLWQGVLEYNPDNARARVNLGNALKHQAEHQARQGNAAEAQALYREAVEQLETALAALKKDDRDPTLAELNLGAALTESGQYQRGVEVLAPLVEREPDFDVAWYNLGLCYRNLNQTAAAATAFQRAFALNNGLTQAGMMYANMLVEQNDIPRSIDIYRQAIRNAPPGLSPEAMAMVYFNLGNSHFRLQQWDDAIASYEQALRIQPGYPRAQDFIRLAQQQSAGGR